MCNTALMVRPLPGGPITTPPDVRDSGLGGLRYHFGRSYEKAGPHEENCPCPKAACGLVEYEADPWCSEHSAMFNWPMPAKHLDKDCPRRLI